MARLVIVEDDDGTRELFIHLFKGKGHEVMVAGSRKELEGILLSFTPDLAILDVMFGGEDGREICKTLKQANPKLKAILMSARHDLLEPYKQYLADDIIKKPFSLKLLLHKVNALLTDEKMNA